MSRKPIEYVAALACAVLALAVLSSESTAVRCAAGEKDRPTLSGAWVMSAAELKLEFSGKDVLKIFPHGDNKAIVIVCQYSAEKKGLVKAKITDFEGKDDLKAKVKERLPAGLEFSFQWTVKAEVATLADLKGEKVELLKSHLEGTYDRKK